MSLATNLKRLRAARGMTQEELASAAGLKQNAISKYEKGKTQPDLKTVLRLATGLRSSLEPLVEGLDVKFDAFYQGLRVSIASDDKAGAEPAETEPQPPFDVIVPGAPAAQGEPDDAVTDLAATHADLQRVTSELISISARLAARSHPMARDLGPGVRKRAPRHRVRARPKTSKTPQSKR